MKPLAALRTSLILLTLALSSVALAIDMKVDRVVLNSPGGGGGAETFTAVSFRQPFAGTPVVVVVPTTQNAGPDALRIRNVTSSGFEVAVVRPDGSLSVNSGMDVHYVAALPGTYALGGAILHVGSANTTSVQGKFVPGNSWQTVNFAAGFAQPPALLTTIQTINNETPVDLATPSSPWMTVAVRNLTSTSVQVALDRAETSSGTVSSNETIGYIAVSANANEVFTDSSANSIRLQGLSSGDVVTQACTSTSFPTAFSGVPLVVTSQNRRDGGDGGWVKRCALSATAVGNLIEEDTAADNDGNHTDEAVGILAVSQAFRGTASDIGFELEADSVIIPPAPSGSLSWTNVSFPNPFSSRPLIFSLPTNNGSEPAALRLRNVTVNGFQITQVEPAGELGAHDSMVVDYIAVVPGRHVLHEGRIIEAGELNTTAQQAEPSVGIPTAFTNVTLGYTGFSAAPAVLGMIQGTANEPSLDPSNPSVPFLTTVLENISSSGFDVALERSEVAPGFVTAAERIGYLAMDNNVTGSFVANDASPVSYQSVQGGGILGFDNGCYSTGFTVFSSTPYAVATKRARLGNNGGWLRRCAISAASIGLTVDEDRFNDSERAHIAEDASIIAFERAFELDFPDVILNVSKTGDGQETLSVDPGTRVSFNVALDNSGVISGHQVNITESVPAFTALVMDAFSGSPFQFNDDSPASGLSISSIEYSDDNQASWTYTPAATGTDPAVTDWRVTFSGSLPPGSTVSLDYQLEID